MDRNEWKKISRIFDLALTMPDERRSTYIGLLCADNPELHQEIDQLLESLEESDQILEEHLEKNEALLHEFATHLENTSSQVQSDLTGHIIGRWTLTELLGHGGMGTVYKAERTDSEIHQTGALKILHKNLNTPENVQRFKLEQQILSGLNHPNIASRIDGGISDDGLPYLIMEYVEGKPILEYCDKLKLSIEDRLKLFADVCEAVQYAHKNLIVHRDLKPENILVTEEGHVKILDFGIAKLLDPNLYEIATIETRQGLGPMSLEFAAPEQVLGKAVTTSTDQYALGILLYELVAGVHPFDFEDQNYRSIVQTIQETDPVSPSLKLSDLEDPDQISKISKSRSTQPDELIKQLRGDLEAIVLKILRKEPGERYNSVDQLRADLINYLKDKPVLARGESSKYRIKKFLKRHSAGIATAIIFIIVVTSLVSYYTLQLAKERNTAQLEAETAEQVSSFLVSLFEANQPGKAQGDTVTARMLLKRGVERAKMLETQPLVQARMFDEIGRAFRTLGDYKQATPLIDRALQLRKRVYGENHPEVAASLNQQGLLLKEKSDYATAESLYHHALEIQRKTLDQNHPDIAESLNNLGVLHRIQGEYETAETYLRDALTMRQDYHEDEPAEIANTMQNLGAVLMMQGKFKDAEAMLREALAMEQKLLGDRHPEVATVMLNLGHVLKEQKLYVKAEPLYLEAISIQRETMGNEHPELAKTLNNLGVLLTKKGDLDAAKSILREATDIRRQQLGENHTEYVASLHNLAFFLQKNGDYNTADSLYQLTLEKWRSLLGPGHPNVAVTLNNIGNIRKSQQRNSEAERYFLRALKLRRSALDDNHPAVKRSLERLMELYKAWDKPSIATAYRDTLSALE